MTQYKIDVVSDTVCPWCYIGKKRLDQAITLHQKQFPDDTFTTSWYPFYLAPDAPKSIDKQEYYEKKFGAERTKMIQAHMKKIGEQHGINFGWSGKTGNTRDSHRLIQLAKTKGEATQTKVMMELFNMYFEANEDITSVDALVKRATKAGLDEAEVKDWMATGKGGAEVDSEVAQANRRFITGVPNFTINGKYEIQGAEEPSAFLQVFQDIKGSAGSQVGVLAGGGQC